uniref:Uncharacterized protein n=1 Tax=Myoviridae sp. ctCo31 TaxID=2825053 RepID=A0A8S5UM51_9CAUD|nr:MAG TPA: hypothetical protein [Myoviridae sp. ctCo31]
MNRKILLNIILLLILIRLRKILLVQQFGHQRLRLM